MLVALIESIYRLARFARCASENQFSCSNIFTLSTPKPYQNKDEEAKLVMFTYDPILGYIPRPNSTYNMGKQPWSDGKPVTFSTTRLGLRATAQPRENKSKPMSAVVVGDSFAFGYQVKDEETWPSCLNQENNKYHIYNGAAPGYSAHQAILRGKQLRNELKPDLVIISTLVDNVDDDFQRDFLAYRNGLHKPFLAKIGDNYILRAPIPVKRSPKGTVYNKEQRNFFYPIRFLLANLTLFQRQLPAATEFYSRFENILTQPIPDPSKRIELSAASIKSATSTVTAINTNLLWIMQYSETISHESSHINAIRAILKEELRKKRIDYVDTYNALIAESSKRPYIHLWNGHHTPRGNRLVCKLINEYLKRNTFTDSTSNAL